MCSERAPDDLTARARIRDAAIRLFADRGIAGASVRDIAQAAGVSSGLLRHHFGSKEALRDYCDVYAKDRTDQFREEVFAGGKMTDPGFLVSHSPEMRLLQRYLVQSIKDGSPAASAMFDKMVDLGEEWTIKTGVATRDPRAYGAAICAMQLGLFLFADQLSRVLDVDLGSTEGYVRLNHALIDVAATTMLSPEQAGYLHEAMDRVLDTSPKE
ncbi:MAG: TetR family transcriptional regulator [Hamadaea sp.]|uniref:TetR/AcrR family transcriptional regulator n=1 Tax=Hamadaea sp. TaxID=2024425 RepID=UPI00179CBAFD|nr:TetR family transcriptional regulator [Hamadaea sp.]NUR73688.1 TetR family transcriptional regulator [Hamadaea sp.]NUT22539.1 TetR family transcriptional regulator [Hamadaea sp.]